MPSISVRTAICVMVGLSVLHPAAPGQTPESQGVDAQRLPYEEALARGDFMGALDLGLRDLRGLPGSLGAGEAGSAWEATAEILALRLMTLLPMDPAKVHEALRPLEWPGWIGVRVALARHGALTDLGRIPEARAEAARLGFVERFLIVGPFDNERGAGQQTALPPESGPVDPDASFEGKDRAVKWRSLPPSLLPPVVDLADLLVPREQCLAYLACTITADRERTVALGLGHSSFCRVWLDGSLVYERDVQRDDAHPDQEHLPVRLRAGRNELMIKCGVTTGPFRIAVRVASEDGGPLPDGVTVSAAPESFPRRRPEGTESRPESRSAGPARDARAAVEARARSEAASVRDLVTWVRLRLMLDLDDRAHPESPAFTARAVAAAPGSAEALTAHAGALRRHVDIAAEKEDNPRLQAIEAALRVAPDHVAMLQELGRTYFQELRHWDLAKGFLDRALAANPKSPSVLAALARLREARGQPGLAERLMREAAASGGASHAVDLASWLVRERRFREASEVIASARKTAPGLPAALRVALALAEESGDLAGAAELARILVRRLPTDHEPRLRLAAILDAQGDLKAALAELESLLELAPDLVEARRRAAIVADRMGQRQAALDHLAQALAIQPGDARLRRLEGWLSGQEKSFEDAFRVDAAALARSAPDHRANPENRPYRHLLRRVVVRVNADGTSGVYRHFVSQVLNQRGVEELDQVAARFDRGEQRSRFKVARLFRGDAPPVEADRPYPALADFPPLRAGDVIEWAYRVDDLRQSFFGNYFGFKHRFQDADLVAVDRSELILLLPKSRSFRFHTRNATLEPETIAPPDFMPDHEGRRYVVDGIEAVPVEPAMPDPDEFIPTLEVSTYRNWDEFASWWWNLIHKQYDVTESMRAKLRELLAGATTREEKIRAIYDFVVTDIRYVAWEFGVHGYKPYRASAIFDRRFGDCKDKALVINALLKEAGIDGYPVLIRLDPHRSREDQTLPLVEHFNHCIVAIPEEDGSFRFLDGTAEYHAVTDLPDADRGAQVVVVKDGRAQPATIPLAAPEDNLENEEIEVDLAKDGSAKVRFRADLKGHHAVNVRARFVNEADRKEELTEVVNRRFGQGTLGALEFSKLSDLSVPVWMSYAFDVGDLLNRDGSRARIKPLWSEFDWTAIAVTETRRFDILLGSPSRSVTVAEVSVPAGWKVSALPPDTVIEEPFARYELKRTRADGRIRFERTLVVVAPRISAADYPIFRRFVTRVAEADRETATLEEAE